MTNPPDPGQPPGPFGAPPPRHPGRVPEPRPSDSGSWAVPGAPPEGGTESTSPPGRPRQPPPQQPPQPRPPQQPPPQGQGQPQQQWAPPAPAEKGIVAALLDTEFEHFVTPRLIKLFYILALVLATLNALMTIVIGLWISQLDIGEVVGPLIVIASPVVWLLGVIVSRVFMEGLVVRFKEAEYLRIIKNKI